MLFDSPANHHIGGLDWYEEYKPVGTYYYRVAAVKNSVTGNWSDVQSAVVQNHVWPGPLTPVNPVDDAVNQSLTLTLQWDCIHPAGEAMTYDVIFYAGHKDSGDGYGASSKIASNIGAKSFSVSDLEYNQEYSWKIIAHDETGQSRDSSWWHFWTLADTTAPTGEILINGGDAETDFHVVILNLSASDSGSGVSYASFSNDGTVWSDWYLYGEQYAGWELNDTHYGGTRALQSTYTVYVRFKDAEGNVSDVYSDNINFTAGSPGAIILNDQTYETIADAMTAASSGDTIYLTEGSYVLRCLSDGNMAIRMEAGVTLMGAGADRTRVIQCASSSGNRFVETASNCAIVGMSLASSWFYVINAEGVDNVLIDSCVIEGASENGIAVFDSMNVTVQRCLLTGNYRGIYSRNAENTNVLNCTVADNSYAGIGITSHEVFIPAELRNNIVMNNPRGFACHNAETIITHNDAYNNTYNYHDITGDLTGTNGNISQDPQFDSDTYNIASGSPCRNTGTNVGLPANGTPDMGWFEYGATGTVSVTSNLASAQFIVYGPDGTYNGSGTSWSQSSLPVGVYAISFSTISNHYTPQFQSVILGHGQTLTFDGTYIADTIPPKGTLHVHYDFYATAFPRVDLTLEMNDDVAGLGDGAQMQFSNDGANWSAMEPYSSLRQDWNLLDYGGDTTTGTKTVFAKVSDALGNWTAVPLLDEILYVPNRRILVVPDDWATLDDAVAAASPGDMVHVEPGTYYSIADLPEGIRLQGSGSDLTTLNISGQDRSLAENSMIDGFNTALLYNYLNKAIISNNRLFGSVNRCISTSGSIVRNNLFDDSSGSSLMVADINTDVSVVNNTFVNASNTNASAIQTAYLNTHDLLPRIENNIIAYNYWGIHDNNSDREHILFVTGFITYWQNSAGNTGGYSSGNDLFGPGCFDADPQFESVTTGDYCLQAGSPCINSGYPEARFNDVDGSRNDRGYTGGPCYNTYPIASFSTTPTIGLCYELILLDASSSSDRESPIDEMYFRWDMNNDGVYDTAYSLVTTTTAILDLPGEYVIGLEVMDRGGFINKTSETIRVIGRHPDSPTTLYPLDDAMDTPTSLTLQWNCTDPDIGDSLTYDVYFGNTSNPPQITTGTAATSITIEALDYSTFYHWRVEARDSAGLITVGDSWSFITEAAPPPNAPEQLVASAVAWNQVELDWTDCSDDELGFRIERKAATEDSWRQVTVSSGAECIDTSVNGGIEYAYRVRAFNASGTSEYDGPTTITTPVAPPSTPYPVFPYNGQTSTPLLLTLDWIDCARADYYNVYLWHAEDDLPSSPVFDSLTSSSVVLVEELDHNTTYSWLVVAYGTGGITSGTVWQFLTEPRYTLLTTAAQGEIETSPSLNLYPPGTTVTLTVTPNDGWQFLNWSGDLESNKITDNPLTLIMNGNKTIIANFEEVSVNVTLEQIRQYLIGIIEFTESQKERADTNGDGKVDVADLINLLEQK
ncbi:right-handed parallel beta-helix repeat-containing protein [candidate division KSB1 bacterium]|nr:right-handed parallel beta-helix repeat-containing protein [candidate division KSB1 bacterium]